MARSLLESFVNGTRQVLSAQLFVSVAAVALAGWTLAITTDVIRERDTLRDRVVQLEQIMAARGEIPPEPQTVVSQGAPGPYPGSISEARVPAGAAMAASAPAAAGPQSRDFGDVIGSLFAPAPPIGTVVLHVRSEADRPTADRLAVALRDAASVRTAVRVMAQGDPSQPGYSYFDGRQNRAAAALVARFQNLARDNELPVWSAQLPGIALPAQGEYSPDRLDITLPPLPEAQAVAVAPPQR